MANKTLRWQLAMRLDALRAAVLIEKDGKAERPVDKVFDQLERVEIRALAEFIRQAGLLPEEAFNAAKDFGDLRNKYAHARGSQSKNDALNAIKLLQEVVEGTVSVLKDHYRLLFNKADVQSLDF